MNKPHTLLHGLLCAMLALLACLPRPAAALDGTFTARESYTVTTRNTSTGARKTYTGTVTGTLEVVNGNYTLIDKTGIAGYIDSDHEMTIEETGAGFQIIGDYPLEAVGGGDGRGIFVIIHLSFFTIAIQPGTFDFNFINPGSSVEHTTTGASLDRLSGEGFADSSTQVTSKSTSRLGPFVPGPVTAPRITVQPGRHGVALGRDETFAILATGTEPLSYQWKHEGVDLAEGGRFTGTRTPSLMISDAIASDGGKYTVTVSNAKGSVTSSPGTLYIGARVTVETEGTGTVSPDYAFRTFLLGSKVSLTAKPGAGQLFTHWTDDNAHELGTKPALSFVLEDNITVTAHFEPNRFIPAAGTYLASFQDGSELTRATSGFLSITVAATGAYSGKLTLNGSTYSFTGTFDRNGDSVISAGKPPVPVVLHLDLNSQSSVGRYAITGTVGSATYRAHHTAYATGRTLPEAGKYTLLLEPTESSDTVPAGTGYATLTVSPTGAAKATGKLADGTALTMSGSITGSESGRNQCLFRLATLYGSKGLLAGTLTFGPPPESTGSGVLRWIKPSQPSGSYYRAGFSTDLTLSGARYQPPEKGTRALGFFDLADNGVVELSGGGLVGEIGKTVTLSTTNTITVTGANPEEFKLTINAAAGTFSGAFKHPSSGAKTTFGGLLHQAPGDPQAQGFFLGPVAGGSGMSGKVVLIPLE